MSNDFDNSASESSRDFGSPDGYFQRSAASVFNKIEWIEEHKDFPVLETLKDQNGFKVPDGFFENSYQRLELTGFPLLSCFKKENAFATPGGYFEILEMKELSRVIDGFENEAVLIPKENNFKVKAGYFAEGGERLERIILNNNKPARVISLFTSGTWKAIAALLVIALGFWVYSFYFATVKVKDCGTMACVDKADLLKSKNLENLDAEELYELVNTKQLELKIESNSGNGEKNKKADSLKDQTDDYLLDEI